MISGVLYALLAGLMWGLIFVGPLIVPEYPAMLQSMGRYLALGLIALPIAWLGRVRLRQLARRDWLTALMLTMMGNLIYYFCLASAIQRTGAPVSTMIIGTLPVVMGAGWSGVLLHEAVGHGLEGDFNRKGSSAYSGRVGEKVASSLCTIVDDGTLAGRRGSLSVDDEGTPSNCNVLIENGVLKGYMQDKLNARLMGVARVQSCGGQLESDRLSG